LLGFDPSNPDTIRKYMVKPNLGIQDPICLCCPRPFPAPGSSLQRDPVSKHGMGHSSTQRGHALWQTAQVHVTR
jgi:hypothetical protein